MERKSKRDNEGRLSDNGSPSQYRTRKNTIVGVGSMAAIAFGFNLAMDAFTKLQEGNAVPTRIEAVSRVQHESDIAELRREIKVCDDKINAVQGTLNTINSILIGKALN